MNESMADYIANIIASAILESDNKDSNNIICKKHSKVINEILKNCGMAAIYPVNPYESFILMALLSQDPFVVYSEVLELSYQQAN